MSNVRVNRYLSCAELDGLTISQAIELLNDVLTECGNVKLDYDHEGTFDVSYYRPETLEETQVRLFRERHYATQVLLNKRQDMEALAEELGYTLIKKEY